MTYYDKYNKIHNRILLVIIFILGIINILVAYRMNYLERIFIDKIPQSDIVFTNQIDNYYRQTYAFSKGSLSLIEDSSTVDKLSNPYDVNIRKNVYYLFDTSYYKGKYYSYYTALPTVFILLPIYLVTHKFLNLVLVNFIILMLAVYFISKLYQLIVENYIKTIPLFIYVISFLTIILSSNIFMLLRGLKYDLPVSCGILFITLSIYSLFKIYNKKHLRLKLILSGIFISFIVCSKPTYVVYYLIFPYLIYKLFRKYNINFKNIIYILIPCIIIGLCQMTYNYLRYDSIFEFGAKYQLTGFNLIDYMGFSLSKFVRGLKFSLFTLPTFKNEFPYIFIKVINDNEPFKEWLYENIFLGVLVSPVVVYQLVLMFKKSKDKILNTCKNINLIVYIIFILLVLINTSYGGISEIYFIDFKYVLILINVISILLYLKNTNYSKYSVVLYSIAVIINILLVTTITYNFAYYQLF